MRRLNLKRASSGFTLIELIITIVIIGVLAAVAIPKFVNLSGDAEKGVANGVAAALASATSVNYSRSKGPSAQVCGSGQNLGTTVSGKPCTHYALSSCGDLDTVKNKIADVPAGYTVADLATAVPLTTDGNSAAACKVQNGSTPPVSSDTFSAYGAS